MAITSPSRHAEFALTAFTRECVTRPSSISRWICDRDCSGLAGQKAVEPLAVVVWADDEFKPRLSAEAAASVGPRGVAGASGALGAAEAPQHNRLKREQHQTR